MVVETGYMYISHLFNKINSGDIIVPSYQREYCWDDKKVELFIDSILRDIPIGVFQFRISNEDYSKLEVVDGLHRIITIFNILLGKGVYFNFEKKIFTLDINDFDYSPFVAKNNDISCINILGEIGNPDDIKRSQDFAPFYEKVFYTQLLKFTFKGTDEEVNTAFARINQEGVQFTPTFVKVGKQKTLKL